MLEQMLSKGGLCIYLLVCLPLMGLVMWQTFENEGVPGWLNEVQGKVLGGSYYPALTVVVLMVPVLLISWPVGLAFDYLTGQGIFAPKDETEARPLGGPEPPEPAEGADR
jgi:hypothetical protein